MRQVNVIRNYCSTELRITSRNLVEWNNSCPYFMYNAIPSCFEQNGRVQHHNIVTCAKAFR